VDDDAYKNQRALIIENESSDTARIKQLLKFIYINIVKMTILYCYQPITLKNSAINCQSLFHNICT
jgi:hypothetical protein